MTQHLCASGGVFLAMKGIHPAEELREVPARFAARVVRVAVPEVHAERHVVLMTSPPDASSPNERPGRGKA
jgi:16S rRNA (guanine527-N7)-methyltransferase